MTEYKWWIIVFSVILIIGYGIIYLCFKGEGIIPSGIEMEKRDWLSFLGSYLGFAGTTIVSIVAIFQSRFYTKQERERTEDERKKLFSQFFQLILRLRILKLVELAKCLI